MKVNWNEKYTTIAVYTFIVLAAAILLLLLLLNVPVAFSAIGKFLSIINPFLWGFAIAYVLNRPIRFFETKVFFFFNRKKPHPKFIKCLSIGVVYILFIASAIGLILIIIPELSDSITNFTNNLPHYITDLNTWWQGVIDNLGLQEFINEEISLDNILLTVVDYLKSVAPVLATASIEFTVKAITSIGNSVIALISGIYMLASKDKFILQTKKSAFAIFPKKFAESCVQLTRESNNIFSSYISGKLLEALLVAIIYFIFMNILGIPYALLISTIMGVAEIIPFVGPFIGAVPSAILLFLVEPKFSLWFILMSLVLQQVDGQILAPRIFSGTTGLTAFWVIFAIILGGGLFGVPGMIIGIPMFAVLYSIIREFINYRLEKRKLSTDAEDYRSDINV